MIYFLEVEKTNHIKIGYSKYPVSRAKKWQRVLGNVLILGIMVGDYQMESYIHNKFSHLRQKAASSELFLFSDELSEFITNETFQTSASAELNSCSRALSRSTFFTVPDIASFLGITTYKAEKLLYKNTFPNAYTLDYCGWTVVPIEDVKAIKEKWELEE